MKARLLAACLALLPTALESVARQPYFKQVEESRISKSPRAAHSNATSHISAPWKEGRGAVGLLAGNGTQEATAFAGTSSSSSSDRGISAGWWIGGALLLTLPILMMAGCMSLSNQMNSPGMVASAVAVVFGKITGRRPDSARAPPCAANPPTPETSPPRDARAAPEKGAPGRVSAQPPEATQYRHWQADTEEKRVHFQSAPSVASVVSSGSTTTLFAATPTGRQQGVSLSHESSPTTPLNRPPLDTPAKVPVYC